jgi:hypothetical protein
MRDFWEDVKIDKPGYDKCCPWRVKTEGCTRGWFATEADAKDFAAQLVAEQEALDPSTSGAADQG